MMPRRSSDGLVGQEDALLVRAAAEQLDGQDIALGIDAAAVLHLPAGFLEQAVGLAQVVADRLGRIVDRVLVSAS